MTVAKILSSLLHPLFLLSVLTLSLIIFDWARAANQNPHMRQPGHRRGNVIPASGRFRVQACYGNRINNIMHIRQRRAPPRGGRRGSKGERTGRVAGRRREDCIAEQVRRLGGEIKTVRVGERSERGPSGGRLGRGQPPVLILIENAFVEKEARARARARVRVQLHTRHTYVHRHQTQTPMPSPMSGGSESASAPANVPGEPWYEGVIQFDTPTHA